MLVTGEQEAGKKAPMEMNGEMMKRFSQICFRIQCFLDLKQASKTGHLTLQPISIWGLHLVIKYIPISS